MKDEFQYQGNELDLFRHALNWKKYVAGKIGKYIRGDVVEVGAGPGNFSKFLMEKGGQSWTFVEPDARHARSLNENLASYTLPAKIIHGTLADSAEKFQTIIYLDVLEHILHDEVEVQQMALHLAQSGHIIILCPAFNFLYSEFDKAIGHHRRYDKNGLIRLFPATARIVSCQYLDSTGFLASLLNKVLLRQSYPTLSQIKFWDRFLLPCSRFTDLFLSRFFGRSVLLVVQLNASER